MDAVILSIGTELATGRTVDTNAAWVSGRLTLLGIRVVRHITVDDDLEQIRAAISHALTTAEVTIVTGGLGPTPDDLTRQAVATAIGEPLEEDAGALDQIRALFERWQRVMPDSNKVQALIPRGCQVISNRRGTAPGIRCSRDDIELFVLPGVPAEMKGMFEAAVAPILRSRVGGASIRESQLACFGISEAEVGEVLHDLMVRDRNPTVGTTAADAIIRVRIAATGRNETEAERLVAADRAEVRRRLGAAVFGEGDDSLEVVDARLLTQQERTIATAESCTGGLLAKRLTDIPGASAWFTRGYVTYSNEAKVDLLGVPRELIALHGAVSEPVAQVMVSGCRTAAGSDFALATTGVAGPGGGENVDKPVGLVYVALARETGMDVKRLLWGSHLSRAEVRDRACSAALNLLRLHLLGDGAR